VAVGVADGLEPPQPAASAARRSRSGRATITRESVRVANEHDGARGAYPVDVSLIAVVLLAAAVVLVAGTEWPRLARRTGLETEVRRARKLRKSHLRVVQADDDDFARAVERDLAALPTIDDRD